jgi:GT2 family glycosyltransferase
MTDMDEKQISIIIVSYNTRDFIRKCLGSLGRDASGLIAEIIVVDNCSADGSTDMIEQEFPHATLIKNPTNLGYARAVNQGIRRSQGRYFLILNPDIQTTGDAVKNLWSFMEATPDAGIAGAKLLNPDGSLQMSCRTFYTVPTVLLRRTFLGKIFPNAGPVRRHLMSDWDHNSDRQVDWVIGACMIVRREAFRAVGGMDERFFLYFEDVDWCFRMKKHGWKVYYVHSAVMEHHHRRQSARLLPDSKLLSHLFSTLRFYDKWSPAAYGLKRERRIVSLLGTIVVDVVLINLSFVLAYYFRYAIVPFMENPLFSISIYRGFMIFVNVVCLFSFVFSGLYRSARKTSFVRDLIKISRAILLASLVIMASTYLTRTIAYSRLIVAVFWPVSALLVTTGRALVRHVHQLVRQSLFDLRRIVIVGEDQDAADLLDTVVSAGDGGYDFVGFVVPGGKDATEDLRPLLGSADQIGKLVIEQRVNEVLVCDKQLSRDEIGRIIVAARSSGAEVKVVSEVTDMLIRGSLLEDMAGVPVVVFPPASLSGANLVTKSVGDFLGALAGLAGLTVLAPAVFMVQSLTHRNYRPWARSIGQLGRVLAGKRSLVGPKDRISGERVKPGVTGIWLTAGEVVDGVGKDRLDVYYLQNWSVSSDLEIMILTLKRFPDLFRGAGPGTIDKEGER